MRDTIKVSISGVRGVVGGSFTPQLAAAFAQAFGAFVGRGAVLVGRDTRPSGPMIERAVVAGLQSVGCKPVLAGIIPTPTMLFLTRQTGLRGGIVITASHNPAPWNALKFIGSDGLFLSPNRAEDLFDLYHQQDFPLVEEADLRTEQIEPYPVESHVKAIRAYVDTEAIRARKLKVAVDCVNGVGALYSPLFLKNILGCDVVPLFDTPSGIFERDPEPTPRNLDALRQAVLDHRCDLGFAQDPDGDRLTLVTEQGQALSEDLTLAFSVQQILEHHQKGPLAINLSTSKVIDAIARDHHVPVHRTRIGEIHVAQAMLEHGCVAGGEHNGGVMIAAIHPCRDSFAAMAILLERLATTRKTLSRLHADLPAYHVVRDKLPLRSDLAPAILRAIRHDLEPSRVNLSDGVYYDLDDAWLHIRRSNTEPVLRLTAEAPTLTQAQTLVSDMRQRIETLTATL
ncbi:MAG TPA: phosphoglucosamine mutase [Kiritimatiellia bacterium]|nr:phosphoglucosamine mutase [Kiritimatiellia bacterium]